LSTTNPTKPEVGSNPGQGVGKSATNHLIDGTATEMVEPAQAVISHLVIKKRNSGKNIVPARNLSKLNRSLLFDIELFKCSIK
jgi:hypothetical protein